MADSDPIIFAEEPTGPEGPTGTPWTILVVDDERDVHHLTRLVLDDYRFQDRPARVLSAYSAAQARKILDERDDICLVMVDVVMEEDDAGLQLVRWIREEQGNRRIRIVLRTGQPGHAPESRVVQHYDINDYREKSQLTAQALITSVTSSLRAWEALSRAEEMNARLEERVRERTAALEESNRCLAEALQRLQADEVAGKRLQFKLLPPRRATLGEYAFETLIVPSLYTSGDFLDYFDLDADHLGFYLADVAGHGVASAFVTILLDRAVKRLIQEFRCGENRIILDPALTQRHLNDYLLAEELDKHLTLFLGVIRRPDNTLVYSPGGHFPPPLLWEGGATRAIEAKGPAVGLFEDTVYRNEVLSLGRPCRLLLFSDGILEVAPGADQEAKLAWLAGREEVTGEEIRELARTRQREGDLPDDITFLSIRLGGAP